MRDPYHYNSFHHLLIGTEIHFSEQVLSLTRMDPAQVVRIVPLPSCARRCGPILMHPRCEYAGLNADNVVLCNIVQYDLYL